MLWRPLTIEGEYTKPVAAWICSGVGAHVFCPTGAGLSMWGRDMVRGMWGQNNRVWIMIKHVGGYWRCQMAGVHHAVW